MLTTQAGAAGASGVLQAESVQELSTRSERAGGEVEDGKDFAWAFEVSPHTQRLHSFWGTEALPISLRPDELADETGNWLARLSHPLPCAVPCLMQRAQEFLEAWRQLSPLQQRLAKGPHRQEVSRGSAGKWDEVRGP